RTARLKDKQQRLLAQVRGRLTPNNPGASTPFARERQRVEAAMQANEFTFRFKQAISIDAPRLVRRRRNFSSVLQPIFQLIRVIVAFARVIEAAIAEIDRRFREAGSKGLGIALSEGVAALDQLGNFCFTGDPRVLPIKVMRLLGTMDSLKTCGRIKDHTQDTTRLCRRDVYCLNGRQQEGSPRNRIYRTDTLNMALYSPGCHLTHQRRVRDEGAVGLGHRSCHGICEYRIAAASATVLAARPDSLKRRALEAEARRSVDSIGIKRAKIRPRIDLGCKIPIKQIPDIVERGFTEIRRLFAKGDQRVLSHYYYLEDPLYNLMLMLTLTITASSTTPEVRPNTKCFNVTTKRRDPALLAANIVTRMLWFLRPEAFPWDKDSDSVLRVSEMTKKIEHKGVNNRMLRELGWIKVKGNRDSPRNCESRLTPKDELFKFRNDLIFLMKEPRSFISGVLRSDKEEWVDRCSAIIKDR
ncbi:hypothetical protein H9L39_19932, partial [Fusarium oxysporum f. sp. albedinis]